MIKVGAKASPLNDKWQPSRYTEILDKLEKLKDGEGIVVAANSQLDLQPVRTAAVRRGFNIKVRATLERGLFNVYKVPYVQVGKTADFDDSLLGRVDTGETFADIAKEIGVTRQRVEQRVLRAKANSLRVEDRKKFIDKLALPYLQKVSLDEVRCAQCKKAITSYHRRFGLCSECRVMNKIKILVASRLRSYLKTMDRHHIAQAMVDIRKYNLKPEEIEGF